MSKERHQSAYRKLFWLSLCLPILLVSPVFALDPTKVLTQYNFASWSQKEGLAQSDIRALAQTTDGYLWLGTSTGLVRFDGVRFVRWEPENGWNRPNIYITCLFAAYDGSLWVGSVSGGISRIKDGQATHYTERDGLTEGYTEVIGGSDDGSIWVGGVRGLNLFRDNAWRHFDARDGLPGKQVFGLFEDSKKRFWVGTDAGLARRKGKTDSFEIIGAFSGAVRAIGEDPEGRIWIAAPDVPLRAVVNDNVAEPPPATAKIPNIFRILFDRQGNLLVATNGNGLYRLRRNAGTGRASSVEAFGKKEGLTNDTVLGAIEDREGNVWVGTQGGLNRFNESKITPFSVREGLTNDYVRAILASTGSDGGLWVGTTEGINLISRDGIKHYAEDVAILSLSADATGGGIWIGTQKGVAHLDAGGGELAWVQTPANVQLDRVIVILEDKSGTLWLADRNKGVFRRRQNGELSSLANTPELAGKAVSAMRSDSRGRVWFGFAGTGLVVYENNQFRSLGQKENLPNGSTSDIYEDKSGAIWTAGEGGVSRLENGKFVTFTAANNLPAELAYGIIEDEAGCFWIVYNSGIYQIDRHEFEMAAKAPDYKIQYRKYDSADGLRSSPVRICYPLTAKSSDGKLWFVAGEGVAGVDPQNIPLNNLPPPVLVEEVITDKGVFSPARAVNLPALTKDLRIDYAALSFTAPERVRFRYKLEGYDRDWIEAEARRQAFYTNLAPGNYRFRVLAANSDGIWNEAGATLDFTIEPSFYQTLWFQILSFLAALLLLLVVFRLVYRWRLAQATERLNAGFEERLAERTRIAQELHDTLLQGFLGVTMRLQGVSNLLPAEPGKAKENLDAVMNQVDAVVEEGRNAVRGIRSSTVMQNDLGQAFALAGEESSTNYPAAFSLTIEGEIRDLHPLVRDEIYRIGREGLTNAFRHSEARKIEAVLIYARNEFRLSIADDGIGLDESKIGGEIGGDSHFGLLGMRERADRIGGKLSVLSRAGAGTVIELAIPGRVAYRLRQQEARGKETVGKRLRNFLRASKNGGGK